ncbi:MAG: response regulator transcription factor [Flavobacteriales bacterium]|nr:response regulator transcription factor [Flavobacteriales bacterium]
MSTRILIADDDALTVEALQAHCGKLLPEAAIVHAADGTEALRQIRAGALDLVLLDLAMPGISGRELLEATDPGCPVIIVTGDPSFALEAFRFNVVDYLVKPVSFERLAQAWRKVEGRSETHTDRGEGDKDLVFVRTGQEIVRLRLSEVRYVKSDSNYVRFVLDGREVTSLMNLKDLEAKLPSTFVRVHRSYIINLTHVEKLDTMDVKIGRDLIPVSETYRQDLIRRWT